MITYIFVCLQYLNISHLLNPFDSHTKPLKDAVHTHFIFKKTEEGQRKVSIFTEEIISLSLSHTHTHTHTHTLPTRSLLWDYAFSPMPPL